MNQESLEVIRLKSRIHTVETAKARTEELFRSLKRQADEPAISDDGTVCFGLDILSEMEKCVKHMRHLDNEIHEYEKAIFKHKIAYGETEDF